jgi:hypothetical protein
MRRRQRDRRIEIGETLEFIEILEERKAWGDESLGEKDREREDREGRVR